MRTFKQGLPFLLYYLFLEYLAGEAFRSGPLTAVFANRCPFSGPRVSWATVSEVLCRIVLPLKTLFHGAYWVTLIFVPIATMLTIMTNVAMNNKAGIIGGVSAMLIITLSIPNGETFLYVFARIFETFIGVLLRFWSIRMWIAFAIFSRNTKNLCKII